MSGGSTCRLGTAMRPVGRKIPCSNDAERRLRLRGEVWTARERGQSKWGVGVWQHQGCAGAARRARRGAPWSGTQHSPPAHLPAGTQKMVPRPRGRSHPVRAWSGKPQESSVPPRQPPGKQPIDRKCCEPGARSTSRQLTASRRRRTVDDGAPNQPAAHSGAAPRRRPGRPPAVTARPVRPWRKARCPPWKENAE